MEKFGFIAHPENLDNFYQKYPLLRCIPKSIFTASLKFAPPFAVSDIKGVRSITGKEIKGYLIGCPLLPKQMLKLNQEFVLGKIIKAGKIAEKLGAGIIGLGAYTSVIGDKGFTIANNLKIAVTSGSSCTSWAVLEAITRTASIKGRDLKKSVVAIIGATGSIGSLCARKLSYTVPKLIITARHKDKLEKLKEAVLRLNHLEIAIEEDSHRAIKQANIVIVTTSVPEALLNINEFNPDTIVCDVSIPKNVTGVESSVGRVTLIKGGLIKVPGEVSFGVDIGLPKTVVFGCMAETMLLTLEEKFMNYSLGDNIDLAKMDEIGKIAAKHGFEVVC